MFTQCEHCKAIFRVNMREVTIAKGKLRCGECKQVFNATKTLSTIQPEKFKTDAVAHNDQELELIDEIPLTSNDTQQEAEGNQRYRVVIDGWDHSQTTSQENTPPPKKEIPTRPKLTTKTAVSNSRTRSMWPIVIVISLSLLLTGQILFNYKHLILNTPIHEPEKIQMLNHNVFVHPNEAGVLLISGTIENTAKRAQPYPVLEISLSNSASKIVALRRFRPKEYLDKYSSDMLLSPKVPTSIKLKIKDPGNSATRFQFDFL